ncbi:MAG: hypothetical protein IJ240_11360 [Clostridia bacterium]|nr:hypothetical protein [Clostridia bacterium]
MTEKELQALSRSLEAREKAMRIRDLHAKMAAETESRGLPRVFLKCLNYHDEKACHAALDKLDRAYREAVSQGVAQRLKGRAPIAAQPRASMAQPAALAAIREAMGLKG